MNPIYTVISQGNKKTLDMMKEIKKNRINYVFIDSKYFSQNELLEICDFYGKDISKEKEYDVYKDPLIFLEDKKYIGGSFEMYEIIFRINQING